MNNLPIELSKKLADAGFEFPECEWGWRWRTMDEDGYYTVNYHRDTPRESDIPCPTTDEIIDLMPYGSRLIKGLAFGNYAAITFEEDELKSFSVPNERWEKTAVAACTNLLLKL